MGSNDLGPISARAGIVEIKDKVSNSNELDVIGNAVGRSKVDGKIDRHVDRLLDRVIHNHKDGTIEGMMQNIQTGQGLTAKQHEKLEKIADALSPKELNMLVERGKISQETANFLIIADGLNDAGMSGDAKGRGLATFLSMSPDAQMYSVETMSDRDTKRVVKGSVETGFLGIRNDKIKIKSKDEELNPQQQRLAIFLAAPRQGPGNVQNFMTGNFDTSRDALMSGLSNLPGFRNLEPEQREGLIDFFHQLGAGGRPIDIKGPEHFHEMGFQGEEVVPLSSLMYQVMADRVSTLDHQVRDYAAAVQDKNNQLKTYTNAMAEVRLASKDKGKTDFSDVTFEDASGKEMSLATFLTENGVANASKLGNMKPTEVQEMLSSLKEKSDLISSDSTQAMTKLQQIMDKYNQATTTQTNLQSKFNTMDMAVIRNQGQ